MNGEVTKNPTKNVDTAVMMQLCLKAINRFIDR